MTAPLIAKCLIFNGAPKEIFGTIVRRATAEDKAANRITDPDTYYIVDFTYGGTDYRGLWRERDCLLVG